MLDELKTTREALERIRAFRRRAPEIMARARAERARLVELQKRQLAGGRVSQEDIEAQVRRVMTADGEAQAVQQLEAELRQELEAAVERDRSRIQQEIALLDKRIETALAGPVAKLRKRLIALVSEIEAEIGPCRGFGGGGSGGGPKVRIPPEVIGDPADFWAQVGRGSRGARVGSYAKLLKRKETLKNVLMRTSVPHEVAGYLLKDLERKNAEAELAGDRDGVATA